MTTPSMTRTGRKPWLAAALSLVCPGLGHLYVGRLARGLWLFLLSLLLAPDAFVIALVPPSDAMLALLVASSAASLVLVVVAVADSWRIARGLRDAFAPREYQRPAVYAAFVVVGLVIPVVTTAVLCTRVFEAFRIASDSMAPTLRSGDRVLVNKLRLGSLPPGRGEIVVYRARDEGGRPRNFVKRVIGLPGDRVEIRQGRVFVNGEPLAVEPAGDGAYGREVREHNGSGSYRVVVGDRPGADVPEVRLRDDEYFVIGDNRPRSADSRTDGPVEGRSLVGAAKYVFLPSGSWSRAGALDDE